MASTLGPTLGGFLTDTFSWHWLFLVNIVPGLAIAAVVWVGGGLFLTVCAILAELARNDDQLLQVGHWA